MTSSVKCARCSQPVTELPVSTVAGVFHQHCWAVLSSERLSGESRNRIKSSQERVTKTLNRFRRPRPLKEPLVCPVCLRPIDQPQSLIHEQCDYTTSSRVVSKPDPICAVCAERIVVGERQYREGMEHFHVACYPNPRSGLAS